MLCIIAYDIASKKRLHRCFQLLSRYAQPLQKSVFLFNDHIAEFEKCWDKLKAYIDEKEDDIRAYPVAHTGDCYSLGKKSLPMGILWSAGKECIPLSSAPISPAIPQD